MINIYSKILFIAKSDVSRAPSIHDWWDEYVSPTIYNSLELGKKFL